MLKTAIQMNFKEHRQALFNIKIKFQKEGQLKMSDYLAVTMVITCDDFAWTTLYTGKST